MASKGKRLDHLRAALSKSNDNQIPQRIDSIEATARVASVPALNPVHLTEAPANPPVPGVGQFVQTVHMDSHTGQSTNTVHQDSPNGHTTRTDQLDNPIRLTKKSDQINSPYDMSIQTDHMDRPVGQSAQTVHKDRLANVSRSFVQMDRPTGLTSATERTVHSVHLDSSDSPSGMSNPTQELDKPTGQTRDYPTSGTDHFDGFVQLGGKPSFNWTERKRRVASLLWNHQKLKGSLQEISAACDVPYGSLRHVLRDLEKAGFIKTGALSDRSGIWVQCVGDCPIDQSKRTGQTDRPLGQPNVTPRPLLEEEQIPSSSSLTRAAQKPSHGFTDDDVKFYWPSLASLGFGKQQLDQIELKLSKVGKSFENIPRSLDHIEWELQNGGLVDGKGTPVSKPLDYCFIALAKTGYYRKPNGYLTPEEQAALEAEEATKKVIEANERRKLAEFTAWQSGLTNEDKRKIIEAKGKLRPPDDVCLRDYYRTNIEK